MLKALGELDEDQWYDEERFIGRMLSTHPDLLRQTQVVALGSRGRRGRLPETAAEAHQRRRDVLELVIGSTLETACVWLGLIERSRVRGDETAVLRVTPVGRWIVGQRVEPGLASQGPTALEVGADFTVRLYRPTPRRIWALSAFAEARTLDHVSVWQLTAEALIRALSSGVELEHVVAFLERANGGPLPQVVLDALVEWDRGYRRVWLRRAVILVPEEDEQPEPIAEVLTEAGLTPEILSDGRIALVYDEPDAGDRLYTAATRALRAKGFAPLGGRGLSRGGRGQSGPHPPAATST